MLPKPDGCAASGCPLATTGKGFCPDSVVPNALYHVIGEAPGKQEIADGIPFQGSAGFVLKQWGIRAVSELQLALEQKRVSISNTLRCLPPDNHGRPYPSGDERRAAEACCRQYDTPITAPTVILCGESPQRYYFKTELDAEDVLDRRAGRDVKGVAGRMGRVYTTMVPDVNMENGDAYEWGQRWVFAPHPAWILRQPNIVEHLQQSLRIAVNNERPVQVEMVDWERALQEAGNRIGNDQEWGHNKFTVLGISYAGGRKAAATPFSETAFGQLLNAIDRRTRVYGHNAHGADLRQMALQGADVAPIESKVFDTMLGLHVTHGHLAGSGLMDLRAAVLLLGGVRGERFPLDFKQYETDIYATCAMDAAAAQWIGEREERQIDSEGLRETSDISHAVAPIFARMKERGVRLDTDVLTRIHTERKERQIRLVEQFQLTETRGKKVLKQVPIWRSDKVLDRFEQLFGTRPKSRQRKEWERLSKDGRLSPDARAFAEAILDLGKGANDAHWLGQVEETDDGLDFGKLDKNGFIYPEYKIHGSPDRPIAGNPNITNFPRPKDDPRTVPLRSAVVSPEAGMTLVSADFSNGESYTTGAEMNDWSFVEDVRNGAMSHESIRDLINSNFGLSLNRQQAKSVSHAFQKSESPFNLASRLFGVSRPSWKQTQQCDAIYRMLLQKYPKMAQFRLDLWEKSRENPLVVRNLFGRKLCCFSRAKYGESGEYRSQHQKDKMYWCSCADCQPRRDRFKGAVAFLGRSTLVECTLRAMRDIWQQRVLDDYSLCYIECHDELVYAVPIDKAEHYAKRISEVMSQQWKQMNNLSVPATAQIGPSWSECH